MEKDTLINKLIEIDLSICQNSIEDNDQFIYDLLRYGFKGYENMTIDELNKELLKLLEE